MNTKSYLMQSVRIREKLAYLEERMEKLRADLGYHPIQLDDSGASHLNYREDLIQRNCAELMDLEEEWKAKRVELERKNDEIRSFIEILDNPTYRKVVTLRYITENKQNPTRLNTWVAVAFKSGMINEEAARKAHDRAIKILSGVNK